jgi:hypothetical protein
MGWEDLRCDNVGDIESVPEVDAAAAAWAPQLTGRILWAEEPGTPEEEFITMERSSDTCPCVASSLETVASNLLTKDAITAVS